MHYSCHCDPCRCGPASQGTQPARSGRIASGDRRCTRAAETAEPPLGAHLVTPRRGYTHHGIYAGEGKVIHYAGLSRRIEHGPVEEVPLARFANSQPVSIRCRGPMPFDVQDIVRRARSRLGESRYRLLSNNCEHFSEWAQFGLSRSTQVDRWAHLPLHAATSLTQGLRVVIRSLSARLLIQHEGVSKPV